MPDDSRVQFLWDRLANYSGPGGGTNLPPKVSGVSRVRLPNAFRVLALGDTPNSFVLGWDVPADSWYAKQIDTYNIYLQRADKTTTLIASGMPPCRITVPTAGSSQTVIFICQPVLRNGYRPPIDTCPTCTATTT